MTRISALTLTFCTISLGACSTIAGLPAEQVASATLSAPDGTPTGMVVLLSNAGRLSLSVTATGIPEGPHGFHLHTTGACKVPDFVSAGGHLNPTGKQHGTLSQGGSHLGDLPNLVAGSSQTASTTIELKDDREQVLSWLFDADGTAVVIHANADDYMTNPTGNAGSRIACGVLKRS
jgi:Cu-Zn family superoxide dismutase